MEEKSAVTALRRFRPPLRAHVTLENGQPMHLVCRKKKSRATCSGRAGPWRFSGDWWEREAWSRDEWDIALQNMLCGTTLYETAGPSLSTASCTTCSAVAGSWKARMTEKQVASGQ